MDGGRKGKAVQTAEGYASAFQKVFDHCSKSSKAFEIGKSLLGVVIDWSDAEAAGLKLAAKGMQNTLAAFLSTNCKQGSIIQRQTERRRARYIFLAIANCIQKQDPLYISLLVLKHFVESKLSSKYH